MNTTLIIALAALVVLGGAVVLTGARRRETTGVLSRETRSRDEKTKRTVSSKEFERESVASRSTALAVPQNVAVEPWIVHEGEIGASEARVKLVAADAAPGGEVIGAARVHSGARDVK